MKSIYICLIVILLGLVLADAFDHRRMIEKFKAKKYKYVSYDDVDAPADPALGVPFKWSKTNGTFFGIVRVPGPIGGNFMTSLIIYIDVPNKRMRLRGELDVGAGDQFIFHNISYIVSESNVPFTEPTNPYYRGFYYDGVTGCTALAWNFTAQVNGYETALETSDHKIENNDSEGSNVNAPFTFTDSLRCYAGFAVDVGSLGEQISTHMCQDKSTNDLVFWEYSQNFNISGTIFPIVGVIQLYQAQAGVPIPTYFDLYPSCLLIPELLHKAKY